MEEKQKEDLLKWLRDNPDALYAVDLLKTDMNQHRYGQRTFQFANGEMQLVRFEHTELPPSKRKNRRES